MGSRGSRTLSTIVRIAGLCSIAYGLTLALATAGEQSRPLRDRVREGPGGVGMTAASAGGLRVFRDPTTGALVPEHAGAQAAVRGRDQFLGTTLVPQQEHASAVAGGGVVMDLGPGFLMAVRARVKPGHQVETDCDAAKPTEASPGE